MPLFGNERRMRVKGLFEEHEVWFPKSTQFNDPFELNFTPSFEATLTEKIEAYARLIQRKQGLTESLAKAHASSEFLGLGADGIERWEKKRLESFIETQKNHTGIFSLTKHKDDILMWSHYANDHKGICIELSPNCNDEEHLDFWGNILPVKYYEKNNLPEINLYRIRDDPVKAVTNCFLTKANQWKYEAEWRTIDMKGPGLKKMPEGIISSVVLGCCIKPEDRDFIIDLASNYLAPVKIFQADKNPRYYELEFREVIQ